MPKNKDPDLRFTESGFIVTTEHEAKDMESKARKEQEAAVAKALAKTGKKSPVEASGEIWLL